MINRTTKIIACVVLIAIAFYGGMKYGQSTATSAATAARTAGAGAFAGRGGRAGGAGAAGGFTTGQIISADAQSITLSLSTGGSKIIFLSSSTTVMKTSTGSVSDLTVGTTVSATGSTNSDGSITASSIQIRPAATGAPRTQTGQ